MQLSDLQGFSSIGLLWDLDAFFVSIRIPRLIKLALDREFPPMILGLSMKVHCGARAFKEGPYISQFVKPAGLSILAGCGGSASFTRAALYDVLQTMHASFRPCQLQTFVDDIPQTHTGEPEVIVQQAIEQAQRFVQLLGDEGFKISPKSNVVASSFVLAKEVQLALRDMGIEITAKTDARDVGTDLTAGGRRRITLQKARLVKVKAGIKAVLRLNGTIKQARKLVHTSVKPRAWGFSVQGTSPTMAKILRSQLGKGLGVRKAGGCLATAMACHGYFQRDPWIAYSVSNIADFYQTLQDLPRHCFLAAQVHWQDLKDALEPTGRWAKVKGPMSAAIATLFDWDFEPPEINKWMDPTGHCWNLM